MEKKANKELWDRYIRFLEHKHSKNPKYIECWGGVWYLPIDPCSFNLGYLIGSMSIYPSLEKKGLQMLNPDINPEIVQEYFTDLIIYESEVIRIEIEVELHLN